MRPAGENKVAELVSEPETGRLTWIGLLLAGIGWVLLLGEIALTDLVPAKLPRPVAPTFHADLLAVAECLIGSGFGLAVIGALGSGFGVLNDFFNAALNRSGQRGGARTEPEVGPPPRGGRPYRTLPDGSVEVETIVGTRRFETMAEAREFI